MKKIEITSPQIYGKAYLGIREITGWWSSKNSSDLQYKITEVSNVVQVRAEGPKAPSPGHRPGCLWAQTCRPVRAKALKLQTKHKAFALTGRKVDCAYTQGVTMG